MAILALVLSMTGPRRGAFTFVLFSAMGVATFTAASVGIVASFIIDDLGIDRAQLGLVIAVNAIVAAAISPVVGRITDREGGKRAILAVFTIAALAFALMGVSRGLLMLLGAGLVGAWGQAGTNPATNKLIAEDLPLGERGVVTGIKQSGVQATIFIGGLVLPSLAIALGWRGAYLVVAVVPLVLAVVAAFVVPASSTSRADRAVRSHPPLPDAVRWLAGYGFLLGFAGSVSFLVPLFTEEAIGFDPRLAGAVAAAIGLFAFMGRIAWARFSEIRGEFVMPLAAIAALSVLAGLVMLAAPTLGAWLVWVGAVLIGVSSSSWNSVGMLAVINEAGAAATGRASGIVLFGFLAGLGLGPPIYGAIVDRAGYEPMWLLSIGVSGVALGVVLVWRRVGN